MTEETEKLCRDAICAVLLRIQRDAQVRYHLGVGTNSFALLTKAYAALRGESVDAVRELVIPGSAAIHRP